MIDPRPWRLAAPVSLPAALLLLLSAVLLPVAPASTDPPEEGLLPRLVDSIGSRPVWKRAPEPMDTDFILALIEQGVLTRHPALWSVPLLDDGADTLGGD